MRGEPRADDQQCKRLTALVPFWRRHLRAANLADQTLTSYTAASVSAKGWWLRGGGHRRAQVEANASAFSSRGRRQIAAEGQSDDALCAKHERQWRASDRRLRANAKTHTLKLKLVEVTVADGY